MTYHFKEIVVKKINISHIENHLFDKNKHGWDRKQYPLVKIEDVEVLEVLNAKPHKSMVKLLQYKGHK
jgi:hypothetical protein